jgi:two-component system, NtrC family, response regulator HydG
MLAAQTTQRLAFVPAMATFQAASQTGFCAMLHAFEATLNMPGKYRILIADDDVPAQDDWRETLAAWGYDSAFAEDGDKALEQIERQQPHVLLCDLRMPRKNGLDLLSAVKERGLNLATVMISGAGQIDDAVQAIKLGAYDYLTKPVDLDKLQILLKNLTSHVKLAEENQRLRRDLAGAGRLGSMIGRSLAMRRLMALIDQVAPSSASILIAGESGTGKEIVARTIHDLSARREGPFIALNCAAIPDTLIESELFGHERGAFTGADKRRIGCFELAEGGTLFLDEIGEMKVDMQAKLLRVLEERKLRRVGGSGEIAIDVRVLAASNRNLEGAIADSSFREDLYYRLNVFTVELPPLRERSEDVALFVDHFLNKLEPPPNKAVTGIEPDCLEALKAYGWPGNVRELRNVMERALIVTKGPLISLGDLPPSLGAKARTNPTFEIKVGTPLHVVEMELAQRTIAFTEGNKSEAARLLGISLKTLYNWLKAEEEEQSVAEAKSNA